MQLATCSSERKWTVSNKLFRILIALCGVFGVAALVTHFSFPAQPPPDDANLAQLAEYASRYQNALMASAWLQAMGSLLFVVFTLGIVHLANATTRFSGLITIVAATLIQAISLLDTGFIIACVKAGVSHHAAMMTVGYDLINNLGTGDAVGHLFLITPPLLLPLGFVILGSSVLPRLFGYLAILLGSVIGILGIASLYFGADAVVTVVMLLQEFWAVAAAITLMVQTRTPVSTGSRVELYESLTV